MVAQVSAEMSSFETSTRESSVSPSLGFLEEHCVRFLTVLPAETARLPRNALGRNLQNPFAAKTATGSMNVFER